MEYIKINSSEKHIQWNSVQHIITLLLEKSKYDNKLPVSIHVTQCRL